LRPLNRPTGGNPGGWTKAGINLGPGQAGEQDTTGRGDEPAFVRDRTPRRASEGCERKTTGASSRALEIMWVGGRTRGPYAETQASAVVGAPFAAVAAWEGYRVVSDAKTAIGWFRAVRALYVPSTALTARDGTVGNIPGEDGREERERGILK